MNDTPQPATDEQIAEIERELHTESEGYERTFLYLIARIRANAATIERLTRERDEARALSDERHVDTLIKAVDFSIDQLAARDAQIAALVTAAEAVTRQYGTVRSEKMEALRAAAAQIRSAAASDAGTCQDTPTG